MLTQHASGPQSVGVRGRQSDGATPACVRIGVGIDTSRYGHYAAFLREDLQPAAAELSFTESAAGYALLRERFEHIGRRYGAVHFVVRVDAAGQYADNLLHFLQGLAQRANASTPATNSNPANPSNGLSASGGQAAAFTISCGDPQRNKNYRAALFGAKKSDPLEARACARYALSEWPAAAQPFPDALRQLRQVAARLQAVVRQRTRLINQLHHLLALTFPELALLTKDISTGWVLELVHRYPTARLLATASEQEVGAVPYLPDSQIAGLLEHARSSVGSLAGAIVEELVRDQVRQLRDVRARQKRLENLLVSAYRALPESNHLDSIPGIGEVTAAVLTAIILDIKRFKSKGQLVAYFGILPIEAASGVDRDGNPRGPKRYVMSRRGNDLVRRYLWMAALSAAQHNPAVRPMYARVVAKHPDQKAIAVGHAMRKLLHLAFAVWQTGKPFDPEHYSWEKPAHVDQESRIRNQESAGREQEVAGAKKPKRSDMPPSQKEKAAGLRNPAKPGRKEITAASVATIAQATPSRVTQAALVETTFVDFAHLKRQLPIVRVLDQLGLGGRLRGKAPQMRCACPIHRGDNRGRTFSVHLEQGVFQCFDAKCAAKGDVIDLWSSVKGMSLRDAALDLVQTFGLEPAPQERTEKRQG
jgi:transposase